MKETVTRYYCDRCNAEVKPYGRVDEITGGFGYVEYLINCVEPNNGAFHYANSLYRTDTSGTVKKFLCKDCFDGLLAYMKDER